MARVPDALLQCAVYLYNTERDAQSGRQSGGSGFLLGFEATLPEPLEPLSALAPARDKLSAAALRSDPLSQHYLTYVVTSKHVVDRGSTVVRLNQRESGIQVIPVPTTDWQFTKGVDVAVALIDLKWSALRALSVPLDMLLTESECALMDIGLGDDVHMVGRFIHHEGVGANQPTVRFGSISMMPGQPVAVEEPVGRQVAFLIESRTIAGYSGSPVFVRVPPWEMLGSEEGSGRRTLGEKGHAIYYLLGVSGGWILGRNEKVIVGPEDKGLTGTATSNTGMMWCVPAWKLLEVLNSDSSAKQRNQWRTQLRGASR